MEGGEVFRQPAAPRRSLRNSTGASLRRQLGRYEPHVGLDSSVLEQRHTDNHTFAAGFGAEVITVMVCTPLSRKLELIFNCGLTSEEGAKRQQRRRSSLQPRSKSKICSFLPDSSFFSSAISTSGTALKDVTLLRRHMWAGTVLRLVLRPIRRDCGQTGSWWSSDTVRLVQNVVLFPC